MLLLLGNSLFGWGALGACSLIAVNTGLSQFHRVGLGLYALSWVMFGLGLYLIGSEGLRHVRKRRKRFFVRFFRYISQNVQSAKLDS